MSDTSKLSYDKIMQEGARETHFRKILQALLVIKDGTSWEIAAKAKIKPDQVWKRQNELVSADIIFDTGIRRNSPDGNRAMVYALVSEKESYKLIQKPERIEKIVTADYANKIIDHSLNNSFVKPAIVRDDFKNRNNYSQPELFK